MFNFWQNTEPRSLVDNNALNSIAKDYANLDCDDNVSFNIDIQQPNESWTAGSSYKEDNFLDLSKLGAIGCERKVSNVFNKNEVEKFFKPEELKPAIGGGDLNEISKEEELGSGLSQCRDFTLIKDGMHIHSKFVDGTNIDISVSMLPIFKHAYNGKLI